MKPRRLSILGLIPFFVLPSWAVKRQTLAQVEETLISATSAGKTDIEIAHQVSQIELSERISASTFEKLNKLIERDPHAVLALQLLADASSFLPLPANELLSIPAPDQPTQQRQLEAMRKYAFGMVPRLPNLLATRTTYSFDDSTREPEKGGWFERGGLHLVSTSKAEASVVAERENRPLKEAASLHAQNGLVTWGEFGSVLLLILNDSAHGITSWSHWERGATAPISVFDYSVPKSESHYQITTPVEEMKSAGGSGRWWAAGGMGSLDIDSGSKLLRSRPAYHGSLWIDPASGTVLRVSLIADLKGNPTLESGAVLVEYGPVRINDQTFICPLRSLALSTTPGSVSATLKGVATEWLNENLFTDYHLFASTSRIVTEQADSSSPEPPAKAATSNARVSAEPPAPTPSSHPPEETSAANQPEIANQSSPPAVATNGIPPNQSPDRGTDLPLLSEASSTGTISQPASAAATPTVPSVDIKNTPAPGASATFHLNVNAVLVPVVVRDRHGNFVDSLQKQDFEVLDDGKPRSISGFLVEKHELSPTVLDSKAQAPIPPPAVAPLTMLPARITVLLFDDLNMGFEEVTHAQTAGVKMLDGLTGSDMAAVVSTSGKINSGITRDSAKLADAIKALRPIEIYQHHDSADCPKVGYYQADLIVNKHDENALQDAIRQVEVCIPRTPLDMARGIAESAARRACALGQQGVRATYAAISEYVHRMANLPGQHNLILISSGFLPIEQEARYEESTLMNLAADSTVIISALDARGLYTTSLTASQDLQGRNTMQVTEYREDEMRTAENAMGELAYGTGGDFYHNNNDLGAGFRALLNAPETIYVLELATNGVKPNGAYHQLRVSVHRTDVQVQARKGYVAPRDERTHSGK